MFIFPPTNVQSPHLRTSARSSVRLGVKFALFGYVGDMGYLGTYMGFITGYIFELRNYVINARGVNAGGARWGTRLTAGWLVQLVGDRPAPPNR